jgi:hypothetical protein
METTCRLFKLRSGEEVLGLLSGENDSTISILKPMVIKTHISPDSFGVTREITLLRNWLEFTDETRIDLPRDHIASVLMPSESTVILYQKSLKTEEKYKESIKEKEEKAKEILENPEGLQDMLNSLFNDIIDGDIQTAEPKNPITKIPQMPFPFINPNTSVGMFFSIPPDIFEEMVENGILDFDFFSGKDEDDKDDENDVLIPEMEMMTDKEKDRLKRKGIDLDQFPDNPQKYIEEDLDNTSE